MTPQGRIINCSLCVRRFPKYARIFRLPSGAFSSQWLPSSSTETSSSFSTVWLSGLGTELFTFGARAFRSLSLSWNIAPPLEKYEFSKDWWSGSVQVFRPGTIGLSHVVMAQTKFMWACVGQNRSCWLASGTRQLWMLHVGQPIVSPSQTAACILTGTGTNQ